MFLSPFHRCEDSRWPGQDAWGCCGRHFLTVLPTLGLRAKSKCLPAMLPRRNAGRGDMEVAPHWSICSGNTRQSWGSQTLLHSYPCTISSLSRV